MRGTQQSKGAKEAGNAIEKTVDTVGEKIKNRLDNDDKH